MTLQDAIDYADEMKPNAFSDAHKVAWLNNLEGRIMEDVFLMDVDRTGDLLYSYPDDLETELMVRPPHDDIYTLWLMAKIDEANGEYTKYANSMSIYNEHYGSFVRWFARTYRPAQGYRGEGWR